MHIQTLIDYFNRILSLNEEEEAIVENIPVASRPPQMFVIPAAISILINRPDAGKRIEEAQIYLANNPLTEDVGMWGPALACPACLWPWSDRICQSPCWTPMPKNCVLYAR